MLLKNIRLFNFKNYQQCNIDFHDEINVIIGDNGSGKTNVLDAIYYLSMTKSVFNNPDSATIRKGEDFFSVKGKFYFKEQEHEVLCNLKKGSKKTVSLNGSEYDRLSDHIGLIPLVMIAPDDTDLIREGSEIRRKFIDVILSQLSHDYLESLMQYNRYLKQRNALLKNFWNKLNVNSDIFDPYDVEIVRLSKKIHHWRQDFIASFLVHFQEFYKKISRENERCSIRYRSQASEETFEKDYYEGRAKDIETQRTNVGIHKDDYIFEIDGMSVKKYASQGQKKSFTIALKLAMYQILKDKLEKPPMVLLDDIFDKLDDHRIEALLSIVSSKDFGQLFITDARIERTKAVLSKLATGKQFIHIEEGKVLETFSEPS